jgi:hypothetical protein
MRVLDDFNQLTLDPVGPIGGDWGMKVLATIPLICGQAFLPEI